MRAAIQEKIISIRGALLRGDLAFVRIGGREYRIQAASLRQHVIDLDVGNGQMMTVEPDEIGPVRIVKMDDD